MLINSVGYYMTRGGYTAHVSHILYYLQVLGGVKIDGEWVECTWNLKGECVSYGIAGAVSEFDIVRKKAPLTRRLIDFMCGK